MFVLGMLAFKAYVRPPLPARNRWDLTPHHAGIVALTVRAAIPNVEKNVMYESQSQSVCRGHGWLPASAPGYPRGSGADVFR